MSDIDDIESTGGGSDGDGASREVAYPLSVTYCAVCGLPPEYCEFDPKRFENCKPWIAKNCPEVYPDLFSGVKELSEGIADIEVKSSGAQPSSVKSKPGKKKTGDPQVTIALSTKKGKKSATIVTGAHLFSVNLADLAKLCKKRYSCGANVSKDAAQVDTVEIQGDRRREIADVLASEMNVPKPSIFIYEDKKTKVRAFP